MKIIILIFWLISGNVFSQMKVVDEKSRIGIGYATVLFYKEDKLLGGVYSDSIGGFTLPKNIDKVKVSCIGYKELEIEDLEVLNSGQIKLKNDVFELNEVVVTNNVYVLGYLDRKKSDEVRFSTGLEVGVFIENDLGQEAKVKVVKFKVLKTRDNLKYRIRFYECDENHLVPGVEITKSHKIYSLKKGFKGLVEVNVEEENIIISEKGLYVSIECLDGSPISTYKQILSKKESILMIEAHESAKHSYVTKNNIEGIGWVNWNEWLPSNYKLTFGEDFDLKSLYVPSYGLELLELKDSTH